MKTAPGPSQVPGYLMHPGKRQGCLKDGGFPPWRKKGKGGEGHQVSKAGPLKNMMVSSSW